MKVQNYTVNVFRAAGNEATETSEGYVALQDQEKFSIRLWNGSGRRCSASVNLNGKFQGEFVLESRRPYPPLERGVNDSGQFTFFKLGTMNAALAGLPTQSQDDTGLLQVTFKPEREMYRTPELEVSRGGGSSYGMRGGGTSLKGSSAGEVTRGFSAGGVGLTGQSAQNFGTTRFDAEPDASKWVVVSLRLVCEDNTADRPRPLSGNTVPPPLK